MHAQFTALELADVQWAGLQIGMRVDEDIHFSISSLRLGWGIPDSLVQLRVGPNGGSPLYMEVDTIKTDRNIHQYIHFSISSSGSVGAFQRLGQLHVGPGGGSPLNMDVQT